MRGRGPQPWPSRHRGRFALIVGLLMAVVIVAVLAWVFGGWPRPGWRAPPPQVPVTAPPR